ncbi:MAG: HEAT repeat domain-containing protein [Planctomycetes bacterium]|nr:HEAT repeat domain-containing protein [Planctomycetota bacterium]
MCHLKKGEKEKAAEYFQEAVDYYPNQSSVTKKAQKHLDKMTPASIADENHFLLLPSEVYNHIFKLHLDAGQKAAELSIPNNTHLYGIDDMFNKHRGGFINIHNTTQNTWTKPTRIAQFTCNNTDLELYDSLGEKQQFEWKEVNLAYGKRCQLIWTPDAPVKPDESRTFGYKYNKVNPLPTKNQGHELVMQNHFGSEVIETFFLVLPTNIEIAEKSSNITSRKRLGYYDIYEFRRHTKGGSNKIKLLLNEIKVYPEELKPVAVDSFPKTYSNDVDPDIKEISVTFDQDMFQYGYAWCQSGSDKTFPKSTGGGNAHYIDSRTCVLPVDVEPGKAYSVFVNLGKFQAFRNTDEIPAREFVIVFATKDADGNPTEIPENMLQRARETNDKNPDTGTPEQIVEKAVKTISTCAEGDAKVAPAIARIKSLDESIAINELKTYMTSENNEIRRTAIYVLYMGKFENIDAAVPDLEKLCSHAKSMTRGVAALALGENKIQSSFEALKEMTLNDKSGYARRCGAYALGLLGDTKAIPVLQQAIEDSDKLVRGNAAAALVMLED